MKPPHYGGSSHGGGDSMTRDLKHFGSTAMVTASSALKTVKSHISGHHMVCLLLLQIFFSILSLFPQDALQPGRVVQLISAATGTAVQIMSRPDGSLFIDAGAPANNASAWNSHWTVTRLDEKIVQLVNNGSFLSIESSGVCVRREVSCWNSDLLKNKSCSNRHRSHVHYACTSAIRASHSKV